MPEVTGCLPVAPDGRARGNSPDRPARRRCGAGSRPPIAPEQGLDLGPGAVAVETCRSPERRRPNPSSTGTDRPGRWARCSRRDRSPRRMARAARSRSSLVMSNPKNGGGRNALRPRQICSEVERHAPGDAAGQDRPADEIGAAGGLVVVLARRAFGGGVGVEQVEDVDPDPDRIVAAAEAGSDSPASKLTMLKPSSTIRLFEATKLSPV